MKQLFAIFMLCATCIIGHMANAQKNNMSCYTMSYFKNNSNYDITVSKSTDGTPYFCIRVMCESPEDNTYLIVNGNDLNSFLSTLQAVKSKYVKWMTVIKTNNMKNIRKSFPNTFKHMYGICLNSGWIFSEYYDITPDLVVLENGQSLVEIRQNVYFGDDKKICKNIRMVFSNATEIDKLTEKLVEAANNFK